MPAPSLNNIQLIAQADRKAAPGTMLDALHRRHTTREFSSTPLSMRHLSQLLWAAYGINRPDGHRTVPAAMGIYALNIYVLLPEGIFLYVPQTEQLVKIVSGDYRGMSIKRDATRPAAADIAIYADYEAFRTGDAKVDRIMHGHEARMAALDAGACTENMYLYCASEGINAVERLLFNDHLFRSVAGLQNGLQFQVAMSVGYPV